MESVVGSQILGNSSKIDSYVNVVGVGSVNREDDSSSDGRISGSSSHVSDSQGLGASHGNSQSDENDNFHC